MTPPPRRPTPTTVAAVLLIFGSSGPPLSMLGYLVCKTVLGTGKFDCEFIGLWLVPLLVTPWWVVVVAGVRFINGRLRNVERLGFWVDRVAVVFGLFALPGAFFAAVDVWTLPSPPIETYLLCAAACYCAICATAFLVVSILLDASADDYRQWHVARQQWEAENAWELVEDE